MAMMAALHARRPSGKQRACLRVALFQASVIAIKMRFGGRGGQIFPAVSMGREKGR
jgi:hypothetical protein